MAGGARGPTPSRARRTWIEPGAPPYVQRCTAPWHAVAGGAVDSCCVTLYAIVAREHLSIRVDPATKQELEREARRRGTPTTTLAESLLREGIRTASHPGITFRDGPAGRRAGLIGGPDIWEVVRVWLDEGKRPEATAGTLRLSLGLVEAALGYYYEYRKEIDEWIERNEALMAEAEAAGHRRRALGSS